VIDKSILLQERPSAFLWSKRDGFWMQD